MLVCLLDKFGLVMVWCPWGKGVGVDHNSELAIGGLVENALAMDVASGVPREALLSKYELTPHQLGRVLEKPRVSGLVDGHRAGIGDAVVRLHHRMAIQSDGILQGILDSAQDEDCPHRFHNARYVIDKLLPSVSYVATESHHTVDVEVMSSFNDGARELEKFVGRGGIEEGFAIEEDDPHLHIGKEFIDERDQSLAGIGKQDE